MATLQTPTVFRSTDVGAPRLMGLPGSLLDLLSACLVDGYGSTLATGTITNDGTNVSDGDTVTIGSIVYTFKTSISGQPAYSVLIGGTAGTSMTALADAINGVAAVGVTVPAGTFPHPDVTMAFTSGTTWTLTARRGGTAGNVALAETSSHLTVSGAALTGGGGTNTKAAAGWTKPFTGTSRASFRMGGGNQMYLDVNDNGPGAGTFKEARVSGFETMSAVGTGTGQFPTVAQMATNLFVRKSATADATARVWTVIADDRTFYLLIQAGDNASWWYCTVFGDFLSYLAGTDNYRTVLIARITENSATAATERADFIPNATGIATTGHFVARAYTGLGGSLNIAKLGDYFKAGGTNTLVGNIPLPSPVDGQAWIAPLLVGESTALIRGKLRGFMHQMHLLASWADQDQVTGSGVYAGHTFLMFKTTPNAGVYCIDIQAWDTN
jgi:hypothetical protein